MVINVLNVSVYLHLYRVSQIISKFVPDVALITQFIASQNTRLEGRDVQTGKENQEAYFLIYEFLNNIPENENISA